MTDLPVALVVEDDAVQRRWTALALSRARWRVVEAECGERAIEIATRGGLALVLIDVQRPGIDGLAVTARIRALGGAAGAVPIVAFAATSVTDGGARLYAGGMDNVIVKSCQAHELADAVAGWRPDGAPLPALRLEPLIGAAELRGLLGRFRTSLAEALAAIDVVDGRRDRAHRIAGLAGTLGFADVSASWLALSEGDDTATEAARRATRVCLVQLESELERGAES